MPVIGGDRDGSPRAPPRLSLAARQSCGSLPGSRPRISLVPPLDPRLGPGPGGDRRVPACAASLVAARQSDGIDSTGR